MGSLSTHINVIDIVIDYVIDIVIDYNNFFMLYDITFLIRTT